MFKLKKIAIATTFLSASFLTNADQSTVLQTQKNTTLAEQTQQIQPAVIQAVGAFILAEAKSALISKAKSFIKKALFGSGGSAGPSIVMLHEDSLAQIQAIVRDAILRSDVAQFRAAFNTVSANLNDYHEILNNDVEDLLLLTLLSNDVNSLRLHHAFDTEYNPTSFYLTNSYGLVAALTMSVMTENVLKNRYSEAYARTISRSLATKLSQLGSAADSKISRSITLTGPTGDCSGIIIHSDKQTKQEQLPSGWENDYNFEVTPSFRRNCAYTVTDSLSNRSKRFDFALYGEYFAANQAQALYNTWQDQHRSRIKGSDYANILSQLNSY
ncbi:hypothetical protein [Rheinheimera sp.]|uniref:hypothetical protein n=1 Tax=Rheinheimera sp. TaxID=1869214 RepID=UPI002733F00C|nr:hypothetical protein [Rheinheimera sp.]MDP2714919.1 hypothetical protein [Rheinheimera sp.]